MRNSCELIFLYKNWSFSRSKPEADESARSRCPFKALPIQRQNKYQKKLKRPSPHKRIPHRNVAKQALFAKSHECIPGFPGLENFFINALFYDAEWANTKDATTT